MAEPATWEATAETIAICTKGHFRYKAESRGAAVKAGQTVYVVDLINWLRPSDSSLATFKLNGSDLLTIIEANLGDKPQDERFLVQVSGCRYRFDRRRPAGKRIVETDIDAAREYQIACNSSDITRTDTLRLGGYYEKLNHELLEPNLLSTAWCFAHRNAGRISAKHEGRVAEIQP